MTMKEHVKISWRIELPNKNYLEFWDEGDAKALEQLLAERYRAGQEAMRERAAQIANWATDYSTENRIRALPVE